jgi:hypothetical protein
MKIIVRIARVGLFGLAAAAALGSGLAASGAGAGPGGGREPLRLSEDLQRLQARAPAAAKERLAPPWNKVARLLREAAARAQEAEEGGGSIAEAVRPPLRADASGAVHVAVHVARPGAAERGRLAAAGLRITFADRATPFVEGWVRPSAVEAVAALPFVAHVRPTFPPLTGAGSVTSEGDAILLADQARQTFGVSGAGVKVGVISDSVDGIASAQASGDLPAGVQVLKTSPASGEGTAMLEIVHDLAPGADLAFYQLAAAGARVIVDDLTFFDQPHFEEGSIAQAVNAAAAQGVAYFTSSGNFAQGSGADRGHYEADFASGGPVGNLTDVHEFAPGVRFQEVTVLPGAVGVIFLQWADRFGQSGNDYDLIVADPNGVVVGAGEDTQDGNDLPMEVVALDNRASPQPATVFVFVNRFAGGARRLEIYYSRITDIAFATPAGSIAGHANASGAITVGAINAGEPGNDAAAAYSSRGPCDLFFPSVLSRGKPDVAAIDGVAVTGAAGFPSPFFGTSAAAPHAAAVAALMLEARPAFTPAQVKEALQTTAVDLGAAGFDFTFGSGRVDALAAVDEAAPEGTPPTVSGLAADLAGDVLTLSGTAGDAEGDITQANVTILDGGGAPLAETGFFDVGFDGLADTAIDVQATGLNGFPTAVEAELVLADAGGNFSVPAAASFAGAEPGAPLVTLAKYSRSTRVLSVFGTGFTGALAFEVNGVTLGKTVTLNRAATKAKVKGGLKALNLRRGFNRIRVLSNGNHSAILILGI